MSIRDIIEAATLYAALHAFIYTTTHVAALGWKHGRGVKSVTNIHVNVPTAYRNDHKEAISRD